MFLPAVLFLMQVFSRTPIVPVSQAQQVPQSEMIWGGDFGTTDTDAMAVGACMAMDSWAKSQESLEYASNRKSTTIISGSSIGMNVVVEVYHTPIKDPASVARICAYHLTKISTMIDQRMVVSQKKWPKVKFITWELDLPDRIVYKLPGKPAVTEMRTVAAK